MNGLVDGVWPSQNSFLVKDQMTDADSELDDQPHHLDMEMRSPVTMMSTLKLLSLKVSWRKVSASLLLLLCLLLALSMLPFSFFYSRLHNRSALEVVASDLNAQRAEVARAYLKQLPRKTEEDLKAETQAQQAKHPARFAIVVITVRRPVPHGRNGTLGYLLQSAASLHALRASSGSFNDSFLVICNVDPSPQNHADAVVLRELLPFVERYGQSAVPGADDLPLPGTEMLYRNTKHRNAYDRERNDYTFCLQAAQLVPARYYLVFQDDAIVHPDFDAVLELSLAKLTKRQRCLEKGNPWTLLSPLLSPETSCLLDVPPYTSALVPGPPRSISPSPKASFAFLKLYFPERWQGFAFERERLLDWLSLGAVGGGVGLFLHACFSSFGKRARAPAWRVFLLSIGLTLLLAQLAGRQNVNEVRRVSRFLYRLQPAPNCCIPAMLYPAPVLPFLVPWLAESPDNSKVDLRISECFRHYELPGFSVEPNVVRHVGRITSITAKSYEKPVEEFVLFR